MKKIFTLFVIIVLTISVSAQAPQKMSYQCVVRNAGGVLVTNHGVGIKISILQGTSTGTVVYQETYNPNPQTNANGLLSIEIGGGLVIAGTFSAINWASGPYFLKTETDPAGGTDYTISGTSQLLSVPYALHAKTVASYSETDPVFVAHPANGITSTNITNWTTAYGWGNHSGLYRPISYVPLWSEITDKPTTVADYGITDAVTTTGNQTIAGNKAFSGTITVITPVNATDVANKAYVDELESQIRILQNSLIANGLMAKDIDGNVYCSVTIGTQVWIKENLKTTKYRNGDLIGTTTPATLNISGETTPKYQWAYDGNESNVATYGRLYTWYAVTDSRNVCPLGWHVPTYSEWNTLHVYLTDNGYGYQGSGNDIAKSMAATSGWNTVTTAGTPGNDQASNNSSGFTALPCGYRLSSSFTYIGERGYWWSSSENDALTSNAVFAVLIYYSSSVFPGSTGFTKHAGMSVRCLRD